MRFLEGKPYFFVCLAISPLVQIKSVEIYHHFKTCSNEFEKLRKRWRLLQTLSGDGM